MRKNLTIIILVLAIILQLSVPIGMIAYGKKAEADLLENGFEYKFKIRTSSMVDGTLYYSIVENPGYWMKKEYGVIATDLDGFAYFKLLEDSKPSTHNYIRFTEENEEKLCRFQTDSNVTFNIIDEDNAYALIKAYDGNVEVVEVYIDNLPAKEWVIKAADRQETTIEDEEMNLNEIIWE